MIGIQIDVQSRIPIYEQLLQQLRRLLALGILAQDEQMPSVRQLASELAINPNTVQRAYRELERDKLIFSAPGRGTFVAKSDDPKAFVRKELTERIEECMKFAKHSGFSSEDFKECMVAVLATWRE